MVRYRANYVNLHGKTVMFYLRLQEFGPQLIKAPFRQILSTRQI